MNQPPAPEAEQPAEQPRNQAHADTPHYGTFGQPAGQPTTPEHHARRTYVGSYMDPSGEHGGCVTGSYDAGQQRGHADQNQATAAIRAIQGADEDVTREAFGEDDSRYCGGDIFDPKDEQTGW